MNWILHLCVCLYILNREIQFVNCLISCKNHNNENIDWFIIYKLPQDRNNSEEIIKEGYGYRYMDSNENEDWKNGTVFLNETKHALSYTIEQIYNDSKLEKAHVLYNDETPNSHTSFRHGHTKGVVNFDEEGGYWLVHSLPKFPSNTSYSYPQNGRMFGQTFLCISLNYSELNKIGKQLFYTFPQIYDSFWPGAWNKSNPDMTEVLNHTHVRETPWSHLSRLKSSAGQEFLSFAKYSKFNADIYDAWLAPYFKDSMFAETWQHGKLVTPSNCSTKYKVENIMDIHINGEEIKETKDHSKWGIVKNGFWVCIGGINRMETQKLRAGGMVCMKIPNVWRAFKKIISRTECCIKEEENKISSVGYEEVKKLLYSEKIMKNGKKFEKTFNAEMKTLNPTSKSETNLLDNVHEKINLERDKMNDIKRTSKQEKEHSPLNQHDRTNSSDNLKMKKHQLRVSNILLHLFNPFHHFPAQTPKLPEVENVLHHLFNPKLEPKEMHHQETNFHHLIDRIHYLFNPTEHTKEHVKNWVENMETKVKKIVEQKKEQQKLVKDMFDHFFNLRKHKKTKDSLFHIFFPEHKNIVEQKKEHHLNPEHIHYSIVHAITKH